MLFAYLLNVGISIVPQIGDTVREPMISSEFITHEVGLITSHLLISILFFDIGDGNPSFTTNGTFRGKVWFRNRRCQKL